MVDTDEIPSTFDYQEQMIDRNRDEPLTGSRDSPK